MKCPACRQAIDTTDRAFFPGVVYHGYCWNKLERQKSCAAGNHDATAHSACIHCGELCE